MGGENLFTNMVILPRDREVNKDNQVVLSYNLAVRKKMFCPIQ